MKRRILFVDDEPLVLEGLKRMLRTHRDEWDMTFVDNGARALEVMDAEPVNVVVSDMRMPGMNGAELLGEVMKRHPRTVRIILSGHADRELILQCVGSTHQYLSKPCDPDDLRNVIRRSTSLDICLENEQVKDLVARMGVLPTVPALYSRMVDALNNPVTDAEAIGRLVAEDSSIGVRLLELINSPGFGLGDPVKTVAEAAGRLGGDAIKSLVLAIGTFDQYQVSQLDGFSLNALWRHSLQTAACARLIAQTEGADPKIADECFVGGMLHDVGKLIFASSFPDQYELVYTRAVASRADLVSVEREVFGTTHAFLGGYLLGLWGLPVPVVEAIALHHSPGITLDKTFSPLTAVHASNAIVHGRFGTQASSLAEPLLSQKYLKSIGAENRVNQWCSAYSTRFRTSPAE